MKAYQFPENQFNRLVDEIGRKLMVRFFQQKAYITGTEILHFCAHDQVNRFILFQINQDLRGFVRQIEHPFFDFEHEEVQMALTSFQAILSQHIRIKTSDFGQLVEKAVFNTIRLILAPMETFTRFFFSATPEIGMARFRQFANYFSDFDFIVQGVMAFHEKNNLASIESGVFEEKALKLAAVYSQKRGVTMDQYRAFQFRELTGYELGKFSTKSFEFATIDGQAATDAPTAMPFYGHQRAANPMEAEPKLESTGSQLASRDNVADLSQSIKAIQQTARQHEAPPTQNAGSQSDVPERLHQSFQQQRPTTLAEQLAQGRPATPAQQLERAQTLADKLQADLQQRKQAEAQQSPLQNVPATKPGGIPRPETQPSVPEGPNMAPVQAPSTPTSGPTPVPHVAGQFANPPAAAPAAKGRITIEQIPLHKQFQFVQKVFAGNSNRFKETIAAINDLASYDEALAYLNSRILNMPEVDRKDKVTQEFLQFLQNKF